MLELEVWAPVPGWSSILIIYWNVIFLSVSCIDFFSNNIFLRLCNYNIFHLPFLPSKLSPTYNRKTSFSSHWVTETNLFCFYPRGMRRSNVVWGRLEPSGMIEAKSPGKWGKGTALFLLESSQASPVWLDNLQVPEGGQVWASGSFRQGAGGWSQRLAFQGDKSGVGLDLLSSCL